MSSRVVGVLRDNAPILVVAALALILFFFRLGDRPLWSSDEGRYAEIPREMLESHDFVTPRLNYVLYFEKPALSYWLTAASYRVFGANEFAARFPVALLGLLTVIATYFFGRAVFGRQGGFFGALVLIATAGFFLTSRYLVIDGPFTFFCTLSLFLFFLGYRRDAGWCFLLSYVCMALAVLTKGLIGIILPGMIIGAFIALTRDWKLVMRARAGWGIALFLAVTVPWFVAVSLKNPDFFEFFFIREHFQRFLTKMAGREAPALYFLMIGALFFFPWTFFVPLTVKTALAEKNTVDRRSQLFLHLWWILVFVFFSFSRSKLPPYILPITPPLALLVGKLWSDYVLNGKEIRMMRWTFYAVSAGIGIMTVTIVCILSFSRRKGIEASILLPNTMVLVALFLLVAAYFLWAARKMRGPGFVHSPLMRSGPFYSVVALFAAGYFLVIFSMEKLTPTQSASELIREIKQGMTPGSRIAVFEGHERYCELGFYTHKRVILVGDIVGELRFGKDIGDNTEYFISIDRFRDLVSGPEKVFFLIKKGHYREFIENKVPGLYLLKETPRGMLFVNRPAE